MLRYLVVRTLRDVSNEGTHDYYTAHEDLWDARRVYDNLLLSTTTVVASIVAVIESTDYDCHPDMFDRNRFAEAEMARRAARAARE